MASQLSFVHHNEKNLSQPGRLPVERLQEAGVYPQEIRSLLDAGFRTVESIAYSPRNGLIGIDDILEERVEEIRAEGISNER
jgi:transcription termination factor NusA